MPSPDHIADLIARLYAADRVVLGMKCDDEGMDTRHIVTGQNRLAAEAAEALQRMASSLKWAAERFADLADLCERDGFKNHTNFMRISAHRYEAAARGETEWEQLTMTTRARERAKG